MHLYIQFKSPGTVEEAIDEYTLYFGGRKEDILEKLKPWIKCGEYITVVFDLEKMTAKIKEN